MAKQGRLRRRFLPLPPRLHPDDEREQLISHEFFLMTMTCRPNGLRVFYIANNYLLIPNNFIVDGVDYAHHGFLAAVWFILNNKIFYFK
ncbi:hypothetical protein [Chromobacterium sp. IIBBL 290-4]|uniref:hypothetical protein n=1 Tax=Chromobacterium sp. IIBBL 290-4 TaxID=2953890 RepID=UPI0020B8180C|nr:hypothetical protein [Chromobacterium sp. IIBBL 290-4]UTH74129.1 hypothetical protein NKT35_21715 [Chromobacterium sp. IIBBL 290-4]